jgi:aryl-alcohol dehydrogenase-like predicted oxidoreductase
MSPSSRPLGRNGPQVNAIGFGAMSIGGAYGPAGTDEDRFALLDTAYELGNNFWDTADIYADSEDVIGKWFTRTGKRSDIFLATKFGLSFKDGTIKTDSSSEYVKAACETSLKRLGVDVIDLYYCHRVDGITPIEKTIEAMADLKKYVSNSNAYIYIYLTANRRYTDRQGKIKYLGLSEVTSDTLRRAHAIHPISAMQIEYSPFALDIEDPKIGLLETCRELGVAIIAYSPMGRGLLTGVKTWEDVAADSFLSTVPKYSKDNFPKIMQLVDKIKEIAARKNCTTAQLTLAWVMAQGEDFIPIPGTKTTKYLKDNVAAQEIELSPEDEQEIREAAKRTEVQGGRYPAV